MFPGHGVSLLLGRSLTSVRGGLTNTGREGSWVFFAKTQALLLAVFLLTRKCMQYYFLLLGAIGMASK
jgi:hypothetical protein